MLLAGLDGFGQELTQTIRGTVRDRESQSPLEGATVALIRGDSLLTGTFTDAEGRFKLLNVPSGRYNLQVAYIGYESSTLPNIVVNTGHEQVVNISLTEKVILTETVEITAGKKDEARNEMALLSARQFTIDETRRYAQV
jgi:hypothetical protein